MVIIEPDGYGCTIYNDLQRSYIRGNVEEVCHQLLTRTCTTVQGTPKQIISIGIVTGGVATAHKDYLMNLGISNIVEIPNKHIDFVLPVIDKQS